MKKLLFYFTTLLFMQALPAQSLDIKFTYLEGYYEEKKVEISGFDDILYVDQTGIVARNYDKKMMKMSPVRNVVSVVKRSHDGQIIYENNLNYLDKSTDGYSTFFTGKKYLRLYSKNDSKTKETQYTIGVFNESDFELTEHELITVDNAGKDADFSVYTSKSPDFSKYLFVVERLDVSQNKSGAKKYTVAVMNAEGQILWKKNYDIPSSSGFFDKFNQAQVNNNGDVLLVEKSYLNTNTKKNWSVSENGAYKPGYVYNTYSITNDGNDIKKNTIDLKSKALIDILTEVNPENQNFNIASTIGDAKEHYIHGLFFSETNSKGEIVYQKQSIFSQEFIQSVSKGLTDEDKNNQQTSLKNYFKPKNIHHRTDESGFYVILEADQYNTSSFTSTSSNTLGRTTTTTTTTSHTMTNYLGDILVISLNSSGQSEWNFRIPKNQKSSLINNSKSYFSFLKDNNLYIAYNENEKNLDISTFKPVFSAFVASATEPIVRILNPHGNLTTTNLLTNNSESFKIYPYLCNSNSKENHILLMGKSKFNFVFPQYIGFIPK